MYVCVRVHKLRLTHISDWLTICIATVISRMSFCVCSWGSCNIRENSKVEMIPSF